MCLRWERLSKNISMGTSGAASLTFYSEGRLGADSIDCDLVRKSQTNIRCRRDFGEPRLPIGIIEFSAHNQHCHEGGRITATVGACSDGRLRSNVWTAEERVPIAAVSSSSPCLLPAQTSTSEERKHNC